MIEAAVETLQSAYNSEAVKAIAKTVAIVLLAGCALLYAGDYASLCFHIPKGSGTLSTIEVQTYYAVPLKDGKTDFMFLKPENQVCVNSLFPHLGYSPCWYVRRHRNKSINM